MFHIPPLHRSIAYSFGLEQLIVKSLQELEAITDAVVQQCIHSAALSVHQSVTPEQAYELITKFVEKAQASAEQSSTPTHTQQPKSLGTGMLEWLNGLDAPKLCLFLADYDPEKAYNYYWLTDQDLVKQSAQIKIEYLSQKIRTDWEACLYGMGGSYSDDQGPSKDGFDLTQGGGEEVLAAFGF